MRDGAAAPPEMKGTGMGFQHYEEKDYDAVCDFLTALNEKDGLHINWNWARFEWMAEHPEFDKSLSASIGLWTEEGRIVGAAIYDMYFGEAFCGVLPGYEPLFPVVLDYAWKELKDENGLGISLRNDSRAEIDAAMAAGFVPSKQTETNLQMELTGDLKAELPAGYRAAELDPFEEPRSFQWLLWQGFDHGEDPEAFEQDYQRTMAMELKPRKHFNKKLSLAAAGPGGKYASYCCLWYNGKTDYAYLEPVCTVPAQRGKGLAKALIYEALNRAAALGARRAYVISGNEFYKKLGFSEESRFTFYWKTADK